MELMRNASKEVYLEIEILSIPALCTPFRLEPTTVPPGMYLYELRTSPEDWTIPRDGLCMHQKHACPLHLPSL